MEAMARIGECFLLGICLVGVFLILSLLTSLKFGLLIKVAIPIFGFLIGMCIGVYLGGLFSATAARVVAIPSGLVFALFSSSISNQSQGL